MPSIDRRGHRSKPPRRLRAALAASAFATLAACQQKPAALEPHADEARRIAGLIWTFSGLLGVIWAAVVVAALVAVARRQDRGPDPLRLEAPGERRRTVVVAALVAATAIVVLGLTGLSFAAQSRLFARPEQGIAITITGHQWWWDVVYEGASPGEVVRTANEIHIPVGRPVLLKLEASDVIHSAWVPNLMGKIDLIPGRQTIKRLVIEKEGTYAGRCAEFCGLQHAHMGMLFIAEPPDVFERWREAQSAPAAVPDTRERRDGQELLFGRSCAVCHAVRGTPAGGRLGPDLTHVGSRMTIGAATLPMTRGAFAAWVSDPHGVKPGVTMPATPLTGPELDAVVSYLESLR